MVKVPDKNPNPVLIVQRNGEISYYNNAGIPIFRAWVTKSNSLRKTVLDKIGKILSDAEAHQDELRIEGHFYRLHFVPVTELDYVYVYGYENSEHIEQQKMIESLARFPSENPNPVLRIASDGRIIYANDASKPLLTFWKCSEGEVICDSYLDMVANSYRSNTPSVIELDVGDQCYLIEFSPVLESGYVCVYGRNITCRKVMEHEVESLAKFPSENPNPVLRVSKEGKIIYANRGSAPILKYWKRGVNEFLPDDWLDSTAIVYSSGDPKEFEIDIGNQVFLVMFSPVNEMSYTCIYGRDITELKTAQNHLKHSLKTIRELKDRLKAENTYLQSEIKDTYNCYDLITINSRFKEVCRKIDKVAVTDATVLIVGETGTGKELVARALHEASRRKDRALIKINCAALPGNLLESELFGHRKGAFTGAHENRSGRFEIADGGTLFLDEIGELPLELQPKLLRALQEGQFEKLGENETISVDVRVIAATNRNLEEMIASREFREDLYYRLNVFPIETIPLRYRKEDITVLTNHFVKKLSIKFGKEFSEISTALRNEFTNYDWPGNVRELENILERAIILSDGHTLELHEKLNTKKLTLDPSSTLSLKEMEKHMITDALEKYQWVIEGERGAAKILDIAPSTLRSRIKQYNIQKS